VELSRRDKTLTLAGIVLALFLGALDQTIVAAALPKIVEDLQGVSRYAWVATAYLLASTVLVPIYGKLADMMSRKRIELFAVVTFLIGSVARSSRPRARLARWPSAIRASRERL